MEFGTDIAMHVIILFTFLSLFYMYYISELSKKSFDREISKNIDKFVKKAIEETDITEIENSKYLLKHIPFENFAILFEEPSQTTTLQNKWLFNSLTASIIVMWLMLFGFIFLVKGKCGKEIGNEITVVNLIKNNITTFLFIGLVEYMFFTNVAVKFIPVVPSTLTNSFFDEIKKKFN